ncbi:MAG TPA: GNAT family N-acetyltransferase [Anaeromyxobacter sp.]
MSPHLIRSLGANDLDAVVAVDREASGRSRREFYARRFLGLEQEARGALGTAVEVGGRLAGFAFAHVLDGEFGGTAPVGVLDAIGVAESARRRGAGKALVAGLEAALAARGVRELRSQVEWGERGLGPFFASCGFRLAPRLVLQRPLDRPSPDDFSWDEQVVRSMTDRDLPAVIRCDRKITGRDRTAYYARKAAEALRQSAVRVSLVAEVQGQLAGFLMARVDFGEFGRTEPTAVLDTIGVDPGHARQHVGRALVEQLLLNLATLRAEQLVTEVAWNDLGLLAFVERCGFSHAQRLALDKPLR